MPAEAADGRVDPLEIFREECGRKPSAWALPRVTRSALRLVWQASRSGFLTAAFFQILGAAMATALVLASKLAVDALLAAERGTASTATLIPVILLIAVVTAVSAASAALQAQQQRLLGEHVSCAAWDRLLDVTGRVSLEFFESPRFFEQLKRVEHNSIVRPVTVTTAIFGLLGGLLGAAGLFIALLTIQPLLVPLLLVAGVPAVLLTRRAVKTEFDFAVRYTPTMQVRDYLRTVLTGRDAAKEVRAFGAERALRTRHDVASRRMLRGVRGQVRRRQRYAVAVVVCSAIVLAATLGLLLYFVATHRVTVAGAGAAAVAVRLLSSRLDQLVGSIGTLFESSVFLEDLERFLALSVEADSSGTGTPAPHHHEIVLSGVSYTYPGSDRPAVDRVDLRIGAGEVVALVGENGSGKTTLAKLIAALYAPTGGSICWDGVETGELEPADVRRSVAVIFQDFVRYQLSALENIGLGEPDEVEDEPAARSAAVQARAADFLDALPRGYQTILSREYADGRDLSVGQWQRVALARAFRRNAPLVVLDEPTSALDPRAEHALFADVRRLLHGRSALLISHRFSSVRSADRIYVMESGRIVESGSHNDLMASEGLYSELFQLQARAYL
jgi:ATP-binding cassette subfamily B protein